MPQPLPPASLLYPLCFISSPQQGAALGRCPWPGARDAPTGTVGRSSRQGSALCHPGPSPAVPGSPHICSLPIRLEKGRMLPPLWPAVGLPLCPQRDVPGQTGPLAQPPDVPGSGQWDSGSCKAGDDREAQRTECFRSTHGEEAGQPHPRALWHCTVPHRPAHGLVPAWTELLSWPAASPKRLAHVPPCYRSGRPLCHLSSLLLCAFIFFLFNSSKTSGTKLFLV